jgi:S-DNA-T family DNA segregation ATPase FtsK/SpoIIIE
MAKKTISKNKSTKTKAVKKKDNIKLSIGGFIMLLGLLIGLSIISHIFNWESDQSQILNSKEFLDRQIRVENILGKIGALIGHILVNEWFGFASIIFSYMLIKIGAVIGFQLSTDNIYKDFIKNLLFVFWLSITLAFALDFAPIYGGIFGFEMQDLASIYIGDIGLGILLGFTFIVWLIFKFDIKPAWLKDKWNSFKLFFKSEKSFSNIETDNIINSEKDDSPKDLSSIKSDSIDSDSEISQPGNKSSDNYDELADKGITKDIQLETEISNTSTNDQKISKNSQLENDEELEADLEITVNEKEDHLNENKSDEIVDKIGEFDPSLELAKYKFPTLDLLVEHGSEDINIDRGELEQNKNKIVETLNNYKIEIAKIKATIGPTVTLYEIVPAPGIRISKIKNLEDDIALSLSALGIRIIAPIPGKGTIGIEVPNKKPSVVSMRSVLSSASFQDAKMDLPIALGKTISNTSFVADLAKMPHLLVAGATGQGKSVGLNAIMASLLYKKHPSELKFVLVDPKKVELTLFNHIERHYLAKLPDTENAIITDTTKVINTLNSLCIEMDDRYEMLKNAMVRNIKEYNNKFKKRKLNPENGHKFLPYIVLVIDEFADLIMTAGKEIETPIARLAQLARAVGIHLIVATQRPSVNVITGIIKANFPARLAFRVTSKIDSRTILDAGGANQLIGKGDMLLSNGNDMIRLQCAFIDTPEVEGLTNFIGDQQGYADAYLLPEYVGDESAGSNLADLDDRDPKFDEAARLIVQAQQGSASLLQRKLKLGYNRAGRIVDQLEAAGIIGPFEGSKARQVLIQDEGSLEQLLRDLN